MAVIQATTVLHILFPAVYGAYHILIALFITSFLPACPLALLASGVYATFATCMGVLGSFGFRYRLPGSLLIFAHHLLLDAMISVVPSVMTLDLLNRSTVGICEIASHGRSSEMVVGWSGPGTIFAGNPAWCRFAMTSAKTGFVTSAWTLVVARVYVGLAIRRAALSLEKNPQDSSRKLVYEVGEKTFI